MEAIFSTERLKELVPIITRFVLDELVPLEIDHLTRPFKQTEIILHQKREQVKALGLWNLHLTKEEGGQGLTLCEFGQISEILSWAPYYGQYTFNCQAPDIGNTELISKFASPAIKEKLLAQGAIPGGNTSAEFAKFIDAEHKKWAQVVKASGAKVD